MSIFWSPHSQVSPLQPKNLAVVRISGQDSYLGKYDSPEAGRNTIAYRRMASRRSSRPALARMEN